MSKHILCSAQGCHCLNIKKTDVQSTIQNLNLIMLKENHQRYAKSRGTFYVQLEDDVLTKKGFVSIMKHFALEKIADKQSW